MTGTAFYTVALCTHNHAERLDRSLADLKKITSPNAPWELLIVDNGCEDDTQEILREQQWPDNWRVRVVHEQKLGLSNARNCAIREAHGEYVIFIDDDESADPSWLVAYENLIKDKNPDAFGGRICVSFEDARPEWLQDDLLGFLGELNHSDDVIPLVERNTSFYGGNFGVRKSVCNEIGGFNAMLGRKGQDNTGGEEIDFYRRLIDADFHVWWTPQAIIYHRIQATKLTRFYFLDLHYRQGRMEATRRRGTGLRIPPAYLYGQLLRAIAAAWAVYRAAGINNTLRKAMNVTYFLGLIAGWAFGPRPHDG